MLVLLQHMTDKQAINQAFQEDGYAVCRGVLSADEVAEVLRHVERYITDVAPHRPSEEIFYEDKADASSLKQIQQLWQHDTFFERLMTRGIFHQLAELVLGGDVVPKNLQYFNKAAGVGQATPPHQDGYYFMLDPCEAITMWLALDEVDEENGCVRYVQGSHRHGMREHAATSTLGFSQGIVGYPTASDTANEVALPASPGDLLIHDAKTIHRADGNRSQTRSRRALGFIYYSARAREDATAYQAYQEALAERMKAAGKI